MEFSTGRRNAVTLVAVTALVLGVILYSFCNQYFRTKAEPITLNKTFGANDSIYLNPTQSNLAGNFSIDITASSSTSKPVSPKIGSNESLLGQLFGQLDPAMVESLENGPANLTQPGRKNMTDQKLSTGDESQRISNVEQNESYEVNQDSNRSTTRITISGTITRTSNMPKTKQSNLTSNSSFLNDADAAAKNAADPDVSNSNKTNGIANGSSDEDHGDLILYNLIKSPEDDSTNSGQTISTAYISTPDPPLVNHASTTTTEISFLANLFSPDQEESTTEAAKSVENNSTNLITPIDFTVELTTSPAAELPSAVHNLSDATKKESLYISTDHFTGGSGHEAKRRSNASSQADSDENFFLSELISPSEMTTSELQLTGDVTTEISYVEQDERRTFEVKSNPQETENLESDFANNTNSNETNFFLLDLLTPSEMPTLEPELAIDSADNTSTSYIENSGLEPQIALLNRQANTGEAKNQPTNQTATVPNSFLFDLMSQSENADRKLDLSDDTTDNLSYIEDDERTTFDPRSADPRNPTEKYETNTFLFDLMSPSEESTSDRQLSDDVTSGKNSYVGKFERNETKMRFDRKLNTASVENLPITPANTTESNVPNFFLLDLMTASQIPSSQPETDESAPEAMSHVEDFPDTTTSLSRKDVKKSSASTHSKLPNYFSELTTPLTSRHDSDFTSDDTTTKSYNEKYFQNETKLTFDKKTKITTTKSLLNNSKDKNESLPNSFLFDLMNPEIAEPAVPEEETSTKTISRLEKHASNSTKLKGTKAFDQETNNDTTKKAAKYSTNPSRKEESTFQPEARKDQKTTKTENNAFREENASQEAKRSSSNTNDRESKISSIKNVSSQTNKTEKPNSFLFDILTPSEAPASEPELVDETTTVRNSHIEKVPHGKRKWDTTNQTDSGKSKSANFSSFDLRSSKISSSEPKIADEASDKKYAPFGTRRNSSTSKKSLTSAAESSKPPINRAPNLQSNLRNNSSRFYRHSGTTPRNQSDEVTSSTTNASKFFLFDLMTPSTNSADEVELSDDTDEAITDRISYIERYPQYETRSQPKTKTSIKAQNVSNGSKISAKPAAAVEHTLQDVDGSTTEAYSNDENVAGHKFQGKNSLKNFEVTSGRSISSGKNRAEISSKPNYFSKPTTDSATTGWNFESLEDLTSEKGPFIRNNAPIEAKPRTSKAAAATTTKSTTSSYTVRSSGTLKSSSGTFLHITPSLEPEFQDEVTPERTTPSRNYVTASIKRNQLRSDKTTSGATKNSKIPATVSYSTSTSPTKSKSSNDFLFQSASPSEAPSELPDDSTSEEIRSIGKDRSKEIESTLKLPKRPPEIPRTVTSKNQNPARPTPGKPSFAEDEPPTELPVPYLEFTSTETPTAIQRVKALRKEITGRSKMQTAEDGSISLESTTWSWPTKLRRTDPTTTTKSYTEKLQTPNKKYNIESGPISSMTHSKSNSSSAGPLLKSPYSNPNEKFDFGSSYSGTSVEPTSEIDN